MPKPDPYADLATPRGRLNKLYKILDKDGKVVDFRLNGAQEKLLDGMHYFNVALKARQLGVTTFINLFMLDACLFNSNVRAGVIAHTLDDAKVIFRDKIRFPYDSLPDVLKKKISVKEGTADTLTFSNNSSIRVATSHRSGTLQYLHISEYGRLCAKYPEKAEEIKTGALNTLSPGQIVFIESTAMGQEGHFYELCKQAQDLHHQRADLSRMDPKFFFFPWFEDPEYVEEPHRVTIIHTMAEYFKGLELKEGIVLSQAQKAWYAKKSLQQGDKMKSEFPATPEEAFERSLEGAYFATAMMQVRQQGRIGLYPFDARHAVNAFWDIGINDSMNIWLHQQIGGLNRFVGYYFNNGESVTHYFNWLDEWRSKRDAVWGTHYFPHDGRKREVTSGKNVAQMAQEFGFRTQIVNRTPDKMMSINNARLRLSSCAFDEASCKEGIKHLDEYRKDWNEQLGTWRDTPRHDENSHGADAFMTFSDGFPKDVGEALPRGLQDRYRKKSRPENLSWMAA